MAKKCSYNSQFKKGYYPDQKADESTRVNGHEACSPSVKTKKMGSVVANKKTKRGK